MAFELAKSIWVKAMSDTTLRPLVSDETTEGIFHGLAPPDADMPYFEYHCISSVPMHCFNSDSTVEDNIVQFSLFDDSNSVSTLSLIRDAVVSAFDRQTLTYDTKTQVGCLRESETGPTRLEDAWQWTLDFRVQFT